MFEFKVNREKIIKYFEKYNINEPEDFFEAENTDNNHLTYFISLEEDMVDANMLRSKITILLESVLNLKLDNEGITEFTFITLYLDYFLKHGIIINQQFHSINQNTIAFIDLVILLKQRKQPTKLAIHFSEFKRKLISSNKQSGDASNIVYFNTFNSPSHLTTVQYLKSLLKLLNLTVFDEDLRLIYNPNSSIEELQSLRDLKEMKLIHNHDNIVFIYASLLIDYIGTEYNLKKTAKVISSKEAEVIYEILSLMGLEIAASDKFDKHKAIDNFRKKIDRKLSKPI